MRLALAQYRELAAFAQFASDLDEATRKQLRHGQRVTELMKQKQYTPLSVAELAVTLFVANEGYLDSVDVAKVTSFDEKLRVYMNQEQEELMASINAQATYDDDVKAALTKAVEAFKSTQGW